MPPRGQLSSPDDAARLPRVPPGAGSGAATGAPGAAGQAHGAGRKELGERPPEDNQSFQYDHEAFLGKEDSKTFHQLTSEESKERLGKIVD